MRSWADSHRWIISVLAVAVVLAGATLAWDHDRRVGYPSSIDEAGYLSIAEKDRIGFQSEGLGGWVDTVLEQAPHAPLAPAMASVLLVIHEGSLPGFIVLAFFLVLLTIAVYGIGERLAGARCGALAAVITACIPGVTGFSRLFVFALPSAAMMACAVYALLRAERLQRSGWAIASGAGVGGLLLARTMTIAFVPGILAAGLIGLACLPRERWRRGLLNLGLLCLAAVAVAAPWYVPNFDAVAEYLTEFGYGDRSAEYGASHSIVSWHRWTDVLGRIAADDLYLVLAILLVAGLVALLVTAIRRIDGAEDRVAVLRAILGSGPAAVGIVALAGYAALSSSRNIGLGFTLPVTVLLVPLAVTALPRFPRARVPVLAIVGIATAVNLIASFTFSESLSQRRTVDVPEFTSTPLVDGTPYAVREIRQQVDGPETRFDATDAGFLTVDGELAETFVVRLGKQVVAFGSRNRVVNTNTVMLAGLRQYNAEIPMAQLLSTDGPTAADFAARLEETDFGLPQVVETASTDARDFEPRVEQPPVEAAARSLGMRKIQTVDLPDGRQMRIWTATP